ncbi:hypothetical protein DVT68_06200 [Dyella solisilvae]|uniref:Uncharacterized protein n=2 Tax=Dyella solisilvae TaxID=1920168 RepID=A0A370KE18_9GAMM|nr:hypothetical protein DVT68_06200 [Dyella solisilvae]
MAAAAQSAFDGTWKVDMSKVQMPKQPDVVVVQNGEYACKTCVPPFQVKADGQDHAVSGHPYYDSVALTVVDARTVKETDKKAGKVVTIVTTTVAPDGKSAHFEFTDSSNTNGAPVTGSGEITRVAAGPAGSHAASGSWVTSSFDSLSDNGTTFTFKEEGGVLSMSTPAGQSYQAKIGGAEAPYKGDPGITSVSVKESGSNVLVETDKRDGKVISVSTSTLSADGKSMKIAVEDKLHNRSSSYVAIRQ